MDFGLTEEQVALRATLAAFLVARAPVGGARAALDGGAAFDPAVWRELAGDLGIAGLDVPEELAGAGGSTVDLVVAAEVLGAGLYGGPFLATTGLAVGALLEGRRRRGRWARLVAGERVAALVDGDVRVRDGGVLDGAADRVLHGATAEVLVVVARDPRTRGPGAARTPPRPRSSAQDTLTPRARSRAWRSPRRRGGGRAARRGRLAGPGGRGPRGRGAGQRDRGLSTRPSPSCARASSSAGRSVPSRRCSTAAPTSACSSSWRARRCSWLPGRSRPARARRFAAAAALIAAGRAAHDVARRPCSSTAAWGSRGSTTPTCACAAPRWPASCSRARASCSTAASPSGR